MSKDDQKISLGNTFQPNHTRTFQPSDLLTETYQPVGQAELPTVIPPLVSGVAPAPTSTPPPVASASED